MTRHRAPLIFVGHGNPMNAITDTSYSREWKRIGKEITPPKAIVCMSAHWLTTGTHITSTVNQKIIYDFYGFPENLYSVSYPVRGDSGLAAKVHALIPAIQPDTDWGLDHGTWSVLKHMFPGATIPVLQISIDYSVSPKNQFDLCRSLRPLRDENILFIGSGNIVHNLQMASMNHAPYDWAIRFEKQCKQFIKDGDIPHLIDYRLSGSPAAMSVPTDDHYRPMLNTLALRFEDEVPVFFNQGIDLASVSMLSFIYT